MHEIIIKDTHRGLYYEDGVLLRVLGAGRYVLPIRDPGASLWKRLFGRKPKAEIELVDMRATDLTLKNQEILTADKVAVRVSVLVQYAVVDAQAAIHAVANFQDRLYSDVQLAARRSLASMTLEEILTNRHRLSEEILRDVKESAAAFGVAISRADVKDLAFPGNLQEIMNKVLAAERTSQAQLVEARTKSEVEKIAAQSRAEAQRLEAEAEAESTRLRGQARLEARARRRAAETEALAQRAQAADLYRQQPALLRLEELATLRQLGRNAQARLHLHFDHPLGPDTPPSPRLQE